MMNFFAKIFNGFEPGNWVQVSIQFQTNNLFWCLDVKIESFIIQKLFTAKSESSFWFKCICSCKLSQPGFFFLHANLLQFEGDNLELNL